MKTETLTDTWRIKQLPHGINIVNNNLNYIAELRTHFLGEPTGYPKDKAKQTAELICEAVNACKEINPDNPLQVAKMLPEMWNLVTTIISHEKYADEVTGMVDDAHLKALRQVAKIAKNISKQIEQ